VSDLPETHYARSADGTSLAYQVSGTGPLELAFVQRSGIPIDLLSEDPGCVRLRKRLDAFSRTVWFDRRGWGASEGDARDSNIGEIFVADLTAVLDAVGFERPALVSVDANAGGAVHFSVAHPERVSSLVLVNSYAHYLREDDYPWGIPRKGFDRFLADAKEAWGTGRVVDLLAPSRRIDDRFRAWYGRSTRFSGGPDVIADLSRIDLEDDVRPLLSSVSCPALVLHREGNRFIRPDAGRYLAECIPGARFVLLPGEDHVFFVGDTDALADEIQEFLTGARSGAEADVMTATVLFTDMVASTEQQARVGAGEWSRLIDRHDAMTRAALLRHRGHEVKTTGDGFLATFDGTGRALRCAAEIISAARDIGLELRAGVHTGEIELRGNDIGGLAVSIAKRICDLAEPCQVLVSETVRSLLVGSGVEFEDRGEHELKGVPGAWRLYAPVH
jgi:class 3 adenylate cyclase